MSTVVGKRIYLSYFFLFILMIIIICAFNYLISLNFINKSMDDRISNSLCSMKPMAVLIKTDAIHGLNDQKILGLESEIGSYQKRLKLTELSIIIPSGSDFIVIKSNQSGSSADLAQEFRDALKAKGIVIAKNYRMVNQSLLRYAYLTIRNTDGETIAVIKAGIEEGNFWPLQSAILMAALILIGFVALSGFVLKHFLERDIVNPVMEISRGTALVAKGMLSHTINIHADNEIGELAVNFNRMTQSLRDSFEKIENSNKYLINQLLTDPLTSMPNRKKFIDDLEVCSNPVIIIFNVDSFQEINDFYGIEAGDMILKELANRLSSLNLGIPYRLYKMHADEYTILIEKEATLKELDHWGIYLSEEVMERPFIYRDTEIYITVSVGIGISQNKSYEKSIETGIDCLRNADMALKRAKVSRKKYVVYQEFMEIVKEYENNIQWTKKLKSAIKDDRIIPYFQPILNNHTGKVEKYECLMRMIDENGKMIAPLLFLNVAKKARLYRYLTKMILEKSFVFFKDKEFEFSINISLDDIMDEKTIGYLFDLIKASRECSKRAVFELLETENIENYNEVFEFIGYVKENGCKIAIDDFGTGYSNFSHLIRMQVDYIKIDASLIKNIDKDFNSQIIARTIANFARELGLKTISEYVHSKEVYEKCLEIGIDYSQGYYLGEPKKGLIDI